MVRLGNVVKDEVTGFTGTATSRTEYLGGSTRVQVTAHALSDGRPVEDWFEEERLVTVKVVEVRR